MAGLFGSRAWGKGRSPLSCSGPRPGLKPSRLPVVVPVMVQPVVSWIKLYPALVKVPKQSGRLNPIGLLSKLPPMIVFWAMSVPEVTPLESIYTPPPSPPRKLSASAVLLEIVTLYKLVVPIVVRIPPPLKFVTLPLMVLLTTVSAPPSFEMPPPQPVAVLLEIVLLRMVALSAT